MREQKQQHEKKAKKKWALGMVWLEVSELKCWVPFIGPQRA